MSVDQGLLRKLRRVLAELYPREPDQRRIVADAGLSAASIGFEPGADNTWFSILDHAKRLKRLDAVLSCVHEEYPDNEVIEAALGAEQRKSLVKPTARGNIVTTGTVGWDFFLAHAGADMTDAEALYDLLAKDHQVFLDKRSLKPGDEWDIEIARAQRTAKITVVLVSDRFEKAYYLREEIAAAIQLARAAPDAHRVVPVFLDGWPTDASSVPYGLRLKNAIDAKAVAGMPGVAAALQKLASGLARGPSDVQTPVAAAPAPARHERTDMYDAICRMLPSQFEQVLFYLKLPRAQIAPALAPQATRAVDVVLLIEQQGPEGLDRLAETIRKVAPGLLA